MRKSFPGEISSHGKHGWLEEKSNTYKNLIKRKSEQKYMKTIGHSAWLTCESCQVECTNITSERIWLRRRQRCEASGLRVEGDLRKCRSVSSYIRKHTGSVLYAKQCTKPTFYFIPFWVWIDQTITLLCWLPVGKNQFPLINTGKSTGETHLNPKNRSQKYNYA